MSTTGYRNADFDQRNFDTVGFPAVFQLVFEKMHAFPMTFPSAGWSPVAAASQPRTFMETLHDRVDDITRSGRLEQPRSPDVTVRVNEMSDRFVKLWFPADRASFARSR